MADETPTAPVADESAEVQEMELHLRGGQTVKALVTSVKTTRGVSSNALNELKWTSAAGPGGVQLLYVRLDAVDAVTYRTVQPATETETGIASDG